MQQTDTQQADTQKSTQKKHLRVLDLYCGAGGAGMGYHLAGMEVYGVDIKNQKRYPFAFARADAILFLQNHMAYIRENFDLIHASPPCQNYSVLKALHKQVDYPILIDNTRAFLISTGLPYVIENVPGAKDHLRSPIMLCGTMFPGLRIFRHRYFEIAMGDQTLEIDAPEHVEHRKLGLSAPHTSRKPVHENGEVHSVYGHFSDVQGARLAMGIPWMSRNELAQAIPPAYTLFIASQLIERYF